MTKGFSARRSQFVKSVRAQAHKEGTCFKTALENAKSTKAAKEVLLGYRTEEPPLSRRNIRGWCSDSISVDDGDHNIYFEDVYELIDDAHIPFRETDNTVSLFDIARPAKRKGAAKEFEVIKKSANNAMLDGEEFEIWEDDLLWDDDWEQIYNENRVIAKRSYSSVLRGNDTS